MKTYEFTKQDGTRWWFFYDRSIRLWTVFEVSEDDIQISSESDYYHDKGRMIEAHDFNFKNTVQ